MSDRVSYSSLGFILTTDQQALLQSHLSKIELLSPYKSNIQVSLFFDDYKFKNQILIKSTSGNFYADFESRQFKPALKGLEKEILNCLTEWREGQWDNIKSA